MTIQPSDLRDLTKSLGWKQIEGTASSLRFFLLAHQEFPYRQIRIPTDATYSDAEDCKLEAIETLASLHNLTVPTIISKLARVRSDSVQYRLLGGTTNNSSIPLTFAKQVLTATEQILRAAACNVVAPSLHHLRMGRSEAQEFIQLSRFDHTERGSFVVRVSCDIDAMGAMPSALETNNTFVREAMLGIHQATSSLVQAIEIDDIDSWLVSEKNLEQPTISSNFCEGLTRLHDAQLNNDVELRFDWALKHPVDQTRQTPVLIRKAYFPVIEEVRQELRRHSTHKTDMFVGSVEQLLGELNESGRREGEVVLLLLDSETGESIRAKTSLNAAQYAIALTAHESQTGYILVFGELSMSGRQPRFLKKVSRFERIQDNHPG
ncbi:hypothetical protein [Orrella sp. 11846]|uniref:hypothetical protein n=1 Tax=Orrella sp. 11846 TaxID=3409913 RepID=UPI003B5B2B50